MFIFDKGADFALEKSLFGAVKLTENVDRNKYSYSGYNIAFDARSAFSLSSSDRLGRNVMICGVDNSSSILVDNRKKVS